MSRGQPHYSKTMKLSLFWFHTGQLNQLHFSSEKYVSMMSFFPEVGQKIDFPPGRRAIFPEAARKTSLFSIYHMYYIYLKPLLMIAEIDLYSSRTFSIFSNISWRQKENFITGSTLSTRRIHCLLIGSAIKSLTLLWY